MELRQEIAGEVMLVELCEDRLDAAVAIRFKDALREATHDAPGRVVLDLGRVAFMDSSGLGAVIGAMKQLSPDRRLELAALNPAVEKVFRLTRMDSIFTIHANPAEACGTVADAG
jgi:anti-sigma B factor antagonist